MRGEYAEGFAYFGEDLGGSSIFRTDSGDDDRHFEQVSQFCECVDCGLQTIDRVGFGELNDPVLEIGEEHDGVFRDNS
jgi:hypothetical protein